MFRPLSCYNARKEISVKKTAFYFARLSELRAQCQESEVEIFSETKFRFSLSSAFINAELSRECADSEVPRLTWKVDQRPIYFVQVQHSFLRVKWMKTRSEDLVFIESVLESVIDEMRMRGFSDRRYSLGMSIERYLVDLS